MYKKIVLFSIICIGCGNKDDFVDKRIHPIDKKDARVEESQDLSIQTDSVSTVNTDVSLNIDTLSQDKDSSSSDVRIVETDLEQEVSQLPVFAISEYWNPKVLPGLETEDQQGVTCEKNVICVGGNAILQSIQEAVNQAVDEIVIVVAEGTYNENVLIYNKNNIEISGGYNRNFTVRNPSKYKSVISPTSNAAFSILEAEVNINGFSLINGKGNGIKKPYFYLGGAIFASDSTVFIHNNELRNNSVIENDDVKYGIGGAIYSERGNLNFSFNIVENNTSSRGIITAADGEIHIEGNVVQHNSSYSDHGGGIYVNGKNVVVQENFISDNIVSPMNKEGGWGAGIMLYGENTNGLIWKNIVTNNSSEEGGSGIFIDDGAKVVIDNNCIIHNVCPVRGGAASIYVDGLNRGVRSNVDIVNNAIEDICENEGSAIFVENSTVNVTNTRIKSGQNPIKTISDGIINMKNITFE